MPASARSRAAGRLRVDHAGRLLLPERRRLELDAGQPVTHEVVEPQVEGVETLRHLAGPLRRGRLGLDLLPLGLRRIVHDSGLLGGLGLFLLPRLIACALSEPLLDPGRWSSLRHGGQRACDEQHQAKPVLTRKLAAGAGAAYRRVSEVDPYLVERAALALAPEGISVAAEVLPGLGVGELPPRGRRRGVGRECQHLICR